ncbi:MAG: HAD family phosphatase [Armatimonadetes bacterium]|nr:HAD family phosphatase [Armatimonadota bacterium]
MSPDLPAIRLIALDLDGTLLTSGRRIHPAAKAAVREALDAGVHVCLASGRAVNTIFPIADALGLRGPIVSCNGAYVLGLDREVVHHRRLPQASRDAILQYGADHGLHANVYVGERVYFSSDGPWAEMYRARTGVREEAILAWGQLGSLEPTKVLLIDSPTATQRHYKRLRAALPRGQASITLSEAEYVELLPPNTNKCEGLKAVANVLSVERHEVAAVGDYLNDLEMIEWAGFSGAVANGASAVKQAAEVIVASNDRGGAAEFIASVLGRHV